RWEFHVAPKIDPDFGLCNSSQGITCRGQPKTQLAETPVLPWLRALGSKSGSPSRLADTPIRPHADTGFFSVPFLQGACEPRKREPDDKIKQRNDQACSKIVKRLGCEPVVGTGQFHDGKCGNQGRILEQRDKITCDRRKTIKDE